jgi:hypothetical protein
VDRERTQCEIQMNALTVVQEKATDAESTVAVIETLQNSQIMPEWLNTFGDFFEMSTSELYDSYGIIISYICLLSVNFSFEGLTL